MTTTLTKGNPTAYLKGLGEVLLKVEATNGKKEPRTYEQAIEESIQTIVKQTSQKKKIIFIGNGGSDVIAAGRQRLGEIVRAANINVG